MKREELYRYVISYFEQHMPVAETELNYGSPYELAVAVILSAQCTDKRVNLLTPAFFRRFPDPFSLATADEKEVFSFISSCSYPNNKTRHLIGMAKELVRSFNGIVPGDMEQLRTLPGVGRKTANVILSVAFNQPAMAVDTHVFRVSSRIGLTRNARNPEEAEKQLITFFPEELLPKAHHWLILHGRYTCLAHKPRCQDCGLTGVCSYYKKNPLRG
ncbi:MAG: endonuclease III [Bacteroidota bacterium]